MTEWKAISYKDWETDPNSWKEDVDHWDIAGVRNARELLKLIVDEVVINQGQSPSNGAESTLAINTWEKCGRLGDCGEEGLQEIMEHSED